MKNTFKRVAALALILVLGFATTDISTVAAADTTVFVTVANGDVKAAHVAVNVTDIDGDNALTINDALYCFHEAYYAGGAKAGYGSAMGNWGLSLTKLWGVENGGSYGYYVNNASAMGLTDPVKNGDYIVAFVYTDTTAFSDKYCFFDKTAVNGSKGTEVTLTLMGAGYDASWNPVTAPVADAVITIDGKETSYKTDANGKVTVKLTSSNQAVISAVSKTATLVPPVCVANQKDGVYATGDFIETYWKLIPLFAGLVLLAAVSIYREKTKNA